VRTSKQRLALFFTVQTLGVGAMVAIGGAGRHPDCGDIGCVAASPVAVIVGTLLIFGELAVVATVLRHEIRVWRSLVLFGIAFLVVTPLCGFPRSFGDSHRVGDVLAAWHAAAGSILFVSGWGAGFWDLLERMRRPDTMQPEDRESSAMWPLD
jgi:hypothetical protein